MLASKYFPHYMGILILYWYLPWVREGYPALRRRDYLAFFGTLAVWYSCWLIPSSSCRAP